MKPTRLFDILDQYQAKHPRTDALAEKRNGQWEVFSTAQYVELVNLVSLGLLAMGFKKGDKIATVSNNRPEWNFMDMGMMQIGVVHVPIYPTMSTDEYTYILKHSDARMLVLSDQSLYNKIKPVADQIPEMEKVYTFNPIAELPNWTDITDLGAKSQVYYQAELQARKREVVSDDLASIIYTSGTTGMPKGVMLTHRNFLSNVVAGRPALPLDSRHKVLSFLPLCHVYERTLTYLYQYVGAGIYYAEHMGTIVENLKEVKPEGFDTVPRLLERVFDTIMTKGRELTGIKKKIFNWALRLGLKFDDDKGPVYKLQLALARKLVFKKWQEALGGRVRFVGSGGAALQPRLMRVFNAAGIPVQEGYGLTETSPLVALAYPDKHRRKFGCVGVILDGIEVKIAPDGEILVHGPNVMKGYYKNPELTAEVIDTDGWFHTGDIGELVDGKFLRITDRKKEIFKMSNGKYVAPQVIENKLRESMLIDQVMVVGENEKFTSALISPKADSLKKWAKQHMPQTTQTLNELILQQEIIKLFQSEVNRINKGLSDYERIKRFRLVGEEWTPQGGELSATLKLKRKFLHSKYEQMLHEIYANEKQKLIKV